MGVTKSAHSYRVRAGPDAHPASVYDFIAPRAVGSQEGSKALSKSHAARAEKEEVDQQVVELYGELRSLVTERMRRGERRNHTLAPTEVVHEAYLRLVDRKPDAVDPRQLRVIAAKVIWDVLVDYARTRTSLKRGGDRERLTLSQACG